MEQSKTADIHMLSASPFFSFHKRSAYVFNSVSMPVLQHFSHLVILSFQNYASLISRVSILRRDYEISARNKHLALCH
jgi:hypothetical protein